MKNIYMVALWGILATFPSHNFADTSKTNSKFQDLKKKTLQGFIVPYVLRYDPQTWSCIQRNGGQELRSFNGSLEVTVRANKEEKNLMQADLEQSFQEAVAKRCSDASYYANIEIKPSKNFKVNGINFLHQSAITNLVPNSVKCKSTGGSGYRKTYISAQGATEQLDYYVYSSDKGRISFYFESSGLISSEDQQLIDELFRGFSLDGSACRGPAKFRFLKTAFESFTEK